MTNGQESSSATNTVLIVLLIIIVLVVGFILFRGAGNDRNDTGEQGNTAELDVSRGNGNGRNDQTGNNQGGNNSSDGGLY